MFRFKNQPAAMPALKLPPEGRGLGMGTGADTDGEGEGPVTPTAWPLMAIIVALATVKPAPRCHW